MILTSSKFWTLGLCFLGFISADDCMRREMMELDKSFDAVAYRDMVFAEAGLTVKDLHDVRKVAGDDAFPQTVEFASLMEAIENHSHELDELVQIIHACQDESSVGASALGIGALVGAKLSHALERPTKQPSAPVSNAEQSTAAPTTSPTTGSSTLFGFKLEGGLLYFGLSQVWFASGGGYQAFGLGPQCGGEASLVFFSTANGEPINTEYSTFVGTSFDTGLGLHVGLTPGELNDALAVCGEPGSQDVFEFAIGAGVDVGLEYQIANINFS